MITKNIIRRISLVCLIAVFLAAQSVTILAADKIAGDLTVTGQTVNGTKPIVTVNGESAVSGRSVFSSSVIETFENSGAVVGIGKKGKIEAAADTKFTISFDAENVRCDLVTGSLTVVDSVHKVAVKLPDGRVIELGAGETANAANNNASAKSSAPATAGGATWLPWAIVVGGAATAIIIGAAVGGNGIQLSGNAIVVSPTR